ncbi:MAG TPA: SDR family oxidoreductase [Tepidiformaceae bacterium]|nr:SDR family oxidoreductase [Tepidiformaceae bacterium]
MEIQGKAAVVTGGGSGIGRVTCMALAARGANVIVADVNEAGGNETADGISRAGGMAIFHRCDVTRTEDLAAAMAAAVEHWGRLDIVYNNAGIGERQPLFEDETGEWQRVVDINLAAVINGTRIAVREMRRRGGGVIVNTASMGGLLPMPGSPVYAATKAGVVNFTRSLAYLAQEANIRVNAVCPTFTDTPLISNMDAARRAEVEAAVGGVLQPEQVAEGVLELIEDDSRAGAIMRVTVRGGRDFAREIRP